MTGSTSKLFLLQWITGPIFWSIAGCWPVNCTRWGGEDMPHVSPCTFHGTPVGAGIACGSDIPRLKGIDDASAWWANICFASSSDWLYGIPGYPYIFIFTGVKTAQSQKKYLRLPPLPGKDFTFLKHSHNNKLSIDTNWLDKWQHDFLNHRVEVSWKFFNIFFSGNVE